MIKVAGVWELGWNAPLSEFDLWNFPLRAFEVEEWYMMPVSGILKPRVTEVYHIQEAITVNPGLIPVYLDEDGAESLRDFVHPEDALYILGKAGFSPWRANDKKGLSVKIETPQGGGLLWPHQCIAIVLYDRVMKS